MALGRTRDLTLRGMRFRSKTEVRAKLERAASLVERALMRHVTRRRGALPPDWEQRVKRKQIQGNGHTLPDLVSYEYEGEEVVVVWTYVEKDVLHILVRRNCTRSAERPRARPRLMVWDLMPWGARMTGT